MGRIIAIANQKGGVGKTTTSINLAASIAEMGKRVLAIDLDPQGNMTSGLGVDKNEVENTVYELMLDECSINESIQDTVVKGLRLIPSNVNLAGAEIELLGINDKEYILKTAVDYIRDDYDFIVIDCPPSLNMLTVNAQLFVHLRNMFRHIKPDTFFFQEAIKPLQTVCRRNINTPDASRI